MLDKIKTEPAVVISALVAIIGAAATLGLIGTDAQGQLVAYITVIVPLIGGLIVRASVTPNGKLPATLPRPAPAPAIAPGEDPVKAAMKAAIDTVLANNNNINDTRAKVAKAAVDQAE